MYGYHNRISKNSLPITIKPTAKYRFVTQPFFYFTCSKNKLEDKWHFTLCTLLYTNLKLYTDSSFTNSSKVCAIDMLVSVAVGNIITSNTVSSAYKVS
jgi:hypothetical protein